MKRLIVMALVLLAGTGVQAAVFERYLSMDNPSDRAILAYLKLADEGKASSDDLAELGVLLLDKGFPKDAEEYLKAALKKDKRNTEARFRLGLVLQRMGKERQAAREYRRVIKVRPGNPYALFMLALAEERTGHRASAITHYAAAYRYLPDLANAESNPLVLDSHLQTEAELVRYRRDVDSMTIKVPPIDPVELHKMMAVGAPSAMPPAAAETPSAPAPAATPALPSPAAAHPPAAAPASAIPAHSGQPRLPGGLVAPHPPTSGVRPAAPTPPAPVPTPGIGQGPIQGVPNVSGTARVVNPRG